MIIIDANVAYEFTDKTEEAKEIFRWITRGGTVSVGGRNLRELIQTPLRPLLQQLERAGKLKKSNNDQVDALELQINALPLKSDDPHVIALAHISGARVLYTKDRPLILDFTNTQFVPRPRGKCCRYANKHRHLLR